MLATLFQYGAFSAYDTLMSAKSLMAYSLALPAFVLIKILAPGFFARQDTRTPVKIGVKALSIKMLLSVVIVVPVVVSDYPSPHVGLALATTLFAWIHAAMLYKGLRDQLVYTPGTGWGRFALQTIPALLAMCLVLYALAPDPSYWATSVYWQRALGLAGIIAIAAIVYGTVLYALGLRARDIWH